MESLAAAHARLLPRLAQGDIEELRAVMLANNDQVMAALPGDGQLERFSVGNETGLLLLWECQFFSRARITLSLLSH